ncbi:9932_t:CDS:2 [Diversispora eburnea]|uniref:9932_t:CDS:1 n=1 Tax=Diversispora eburnea TaxID=1213867 RepID=A0A9N9G4V0_9GLOM|nr:9932_t:CDS:2 [Diversispora eburnea]
MVDIEFSSLRKQNELQDINTAKIVNPIKRSMMEIINNNINNGNGNNESNSSSGSQQNLLRTNARSSNLSTNNN